MNDDWDGVDWAEHFSGPDDDEIEQTQSTDYAEDLEGECIGDADATGEYYRELERSIESEKKSPIQLSLVLPNIAEVNTFTSAARRLGASNFKVLKATQVNFEQTSNDWNRTEFTISLTVPPGTDTLFYRDGMPWTMPEIRHLIEQYCLGHSITYLCHHLNRTDAAIFDRLKDWDLVIQVNKFEDADVAEPDAIRCGTLSHWDAANLFDLGVITMPSKPLNNIDIASLGPVNKLNLFTFLLEHFNPNLAIDAAVAAGEPELIFKLARQFDCTPASCYGIIRDLDGLSPFVHYQRELLRAKISADCLHKIPSLISKWIAGAKIRVNDWQNRGQTPPTRDDFPFTDRELDTLPTDLLALIHSSNQSELERMTDAGSKMAACFLSDLHRRRAWVTLNEPHDAPDFAAKIQGNYWPTAEHLASMLSKALIFDAIYATKMHAAASSQANFEHNHA